MTRILAELSCIQNNAHQQCTGENPRAVQTQQTGENNLMVVKTQRTGTNLRAEVTHSHTSIFDRAKGRTRSAQTNQNKERSGSKNVFRRLGQAPDMSDTLNRKRDQERSQHSTAYNGRQMVAPRGKREISPKELFHLIATMKENDQELITTTTGSPFNRDIHEVRLTEGFKLLAIKAYEGKSDP